MYNRERFEVEHAKLTFIEDPRWFSDCHVEIVVEEELVQPRGLTRQREAHGTITFREPPPDGFFYKEDGMPRMFDVVAENDRRRLDVECLLMVDELDETTLEYVAMDMELITFGN